MTNSTLWLTVLKKSRHVRMHVADHEQDKHMIASCIQGYHVYYVYLSTSAFAAAMALDVAFKDRYPEGSGKLE